MPLVGKDHQQILGILASRGIATSRELQEATRKSQPTVSRLLSDLSGQVLALGRARATRYGLPKSIHGLSAQQPLFWTSEEGLTTRIGTLSLLAHDVVHVDTDRVESITTGVLPWYLAPLQAQGFLGRLLAQRLALHGVDADPQRWNVETVLFAALHLHDAPGALTLGEPVAAQRHVPLPVDTRRLPAALDALALDVARTLPAGSSAGGEQPKFLALMEDGRHVLVKFTPPRGTPFGERWSDLLHAESLASGVLAEHGVPVASTSVVQSAARTYLLSDRFDRVGERGRRHVLPVGAAHNAFVAGSYTHWAASCEALARQRRLSEVDAARAAALLQFGRLIGNTDMHSGNLGLIVQPQDLAKGRFSLAPVYDMLPMRWRPDVLMGGACDYGPFEPDALSAASAAATPAVDFWLRLASLDVVSRALRDVAAEMARRVRQAH
ncbi:HipA domain-containing protein [Azohydromonas lata]|uniref:HipA domain-containing protein n=1 Tax=Azohydromonas lata TaxID=45677 RepID=A0ABU5I789_9BURK|nr:HipA domain-containing protein [Azohydromonas lata]MDZ5454962.1 HipA domain-containing protein [Azohydromonas lata]